jgi:hypothetical protein
MAELVAEALGCPSIGTPSGIASKATAKPLQLKRRPAPGSPEEAKLARAANEAANEAVDLLRNEDRQADARKANRGKKAAVEEAAADANDDEEDASTIGRLTQLLNGILGEKKNRAGRTTGGWPLFGDAVIQIGLTVGLYGQPACCSRHILTLGTCDPIANGVDVRSFDREEDMLEAFVDLVTAIDPDVLLGYNIFGFDLSYMHDRAGELMGEAGRAARFHRFGRIRGLPSAYVEQKLSSSALGDNVLKYLDMHGRIVVDLMKVVQRDHRLDSYKLDAVAEHFLGDRKHDVSPSDVFRLQRGTAADRRVIAEYCVQVGLIGGRSVGALGRWRRSRHLMRHAIGHPLSGRRMGDRMGCRGINHTSRPGSIFYAPAARTCGPLRSAHLRERGTPAPGPLRSPPGG